MKFKDLCNYIFCNKFFVFLVYIIVLLLFIYQHTTGLSWDFMAYTLNAKYMFSQGIYFEWLRPPLVSFLIGIFSFFGNFIFGQYLYIVFVVSLHFFSCFMISRKYNINMNIFYILSLTPFFFINGLRVGSELLSLSLLQLVIAFLGSKFFGILLGLLVLTRYENLIFLILFLFSKKVKRIFFNIFLFLLVLLPWLFFNYHMSGNFLTSFLDLYAINIKFRDYIITSFNFKFLLYPLGFFLPLFFIGLYQRVKKIKLIDLVMVVIIGLILFVYFQIPIKTPRYLFGFILPISYFSYYGLMKIRFKKKLFFIIIILNLLLLIFLFSHIPLESSNRYVNATFYLDDCMVSSNAWVHLNYLGYTAKSAPRVELFDYEINEGYRILLFYGIDEPAYIENKSFLEKYPTIEKNDNFILLGNKNKCVNKTRMDGTYLGNLNNTSFLIYNQSIPISTCETLFDRKCLK